MRGSTALLALFVSGSLLSAASSAFGHAHLTFPMRRDNCQSMDDATCKTAGPCGGTPNPAITPTIFYVGSSYSLTWDETINHISTYQINLATNGEASQAVFNRVVMADNAVPDQAAAMTSYDYDWVAPDTDQCQDPQNPCVFQLIQDMDATPGALADPYYNCADIVILPAGATPPPTPDPTATPTPNPSNPDDPINVDGYGSCSVGAAGGVGGAGFALVVLLGAMLRRRRT